MAEFGAEFGRLSAADQASGVSSGQEKPTVIDELRQLYASGRQFASAELAYQATRARLMGKAIAWIAAGGALAAALLFFALMALVVGLLLALAPALGPWGSLAAVLGGLLLATALAGLMAWYGLRNFMALLHDGKDAA